MMTPQKNRNDAKHKNNIQSSNGTPGEGGGPVRGDADRSGEGVCQQAIGEDASRGEGRMVSLCAMCYFYCR